MPNGPRVIMLGAGFSHCVTRGHLPLTSKLLDEVNASTYPALASFMGSLDDPADARNLEVLLRELDTLLEVPLEKRRDVLAAKPDPSSIKRELYTYCIRRLCSGGPIQSWAVTFLGNVSQGATIITTNYDNLGERIVSNVPGHTHGPLGTCPHCRMRRMLESDCSCPGGFALPEDIWRGSFIKLHGSVSWRTCRTERCDGANCLTADAHCRPFAEHTCPCCAGQCEPVLVMPHLRSKYLAFPRIKVMWDAAAAAIEDATELVVFGFSFPASDTEVAALYKHALRASSRLKQAWIVDVDPDPVAQRFRGLLKAGADVKIECLKARKDYEAPDWWEDIVRKHGRPRAA